MERFVVEFIENGIAKCETQNKSFKEIEISLLPQGVKSGDILAFDNEKYMILNEETDVEKQKMLDLQSRLFGKKK
ncbi:MAG: DUF3006 domain-containing protein [Clostridia bacterium]|nr:DUF3006 domain-containing protein [Clostridia bacterium]